MILVDTNIVLRLIQPGHAHRQAALDSIVKLATSEGEVCVIAPQILYEFYVVCTRPAAAHGLGMTPVEAHAELGRLRAVFPLYPDTAQVYPVWEALLAKHAVQGKRAHDARLVAFMVEHRIPRMLTFNDGDFRLFNEIIPLNPFDVLGVPRA